MSAVDKYTRIGDIENPERRDVLVQAIAERRGCDVAEVSEEVESILSNFDVDAVYVE
ncbi:hypothetical protein [Halorubrum sp. C191]|uniref:hypothetical protein n=1 Tax=Halorubrum sp. C191 TaxID=1383842 RepID=UPI0013040604|nr:hypothetical protein [Halorubrum sp. C191]